MSAKERIGNYEVDYSSPPLGQGGGGVVYRGIDLEDGKSIAVKVIPKGKVQLHLVDHILAIPKRLSFDHPNIITTYHTEEKEHSLYIFMELCDGDLYKYFSHNSDMDLKGRLQIILQIARGLEALHQTDIVHRDIKPQNVLVKDMGEGKIPCCKLTDFDYSKEINYEMETSAMSTNTGTSTYKAPEFWEVGKLFYHRDVDIYSLGLMLLGLLQQLKSGEKSIRPYLETYKHESEKHYATAIGDLIHRRMIYKQNQESLDVVEIDPNDNHMKKRVKTLIKKMTNADPKQRPNVSGVVQALQELIRGQSPEETPDRDIVPQVSIAMGASSTENPERGAVNLYTTKPFILKGEFSYRNINNIGCFNLVALPARVAKRGEQFKPPGIEVLIERNKQWFPIGKIPSVYSDEVRDARDNNEITEVEVVDAWYSKDRYEKTVTKTKIVITKVGNWSKEMKE